MSIQDCLKFKRSLSDPEDRALFETEFADQLANGIPAADAYRYAAELTMEGLLNERNDLAKEIQAKGATVRELNIEQLLTPPKPETMSLFEPTPSYEVGTKGKALTVQETKDAQYDLFADSGVSGETARAQYADTFLTRYEQVEVSTFQSGLDHINEPGDMAHVIAQIRKHAQETFVVAVTDGAGKILNVFRHSKGTKDGASVYPLDVIGAIADTPGGAYYWMAHNHPSGVVEQSQADVRITKRIQQFAIGMGVDFRAHVVVGDGVYSVVESERGPFPATGKLDIPGHPRKKKISLTERVLRMRKTKGLRALTSPIGAKEYVKNLEAESGLLFLDNRNQPLGVMALSPVEMGQLRDGIQIPRLLKNISQTNAAASMSFVKSSEIDDVKALENLGNLLARYKDEFRHLDAFYYSDGGALLSSSESGASLGSAGARVYSRRGMKTFYSAFTRHFKDVQVKEATALQWVKQIRKMPQKGVPQAEIDYSGVIDWLDMYGIIGNTIKKEAVLSFIEHQEVDIREINLVGKETLRQSTWVGDRAQEILDDAIMDLINRERLGGLSPPDPFTSDGADVAMHEVYGEWVNKRQQEIAANPTKALVLGGLHVKNIEGRILPDGSREEPYDGMSWGVYNGIGDLIDGSYGSEADAQHALDNTDYEEDLKDFDMPAFGIEAALDKAVEEAIFNESLMTRHEVMNRITPGGYEDYQEIVVEHVNPNYEDIEGSESHFPFPNQVGWVRFTVRYQFGKKVMFIEEIQDDIRQRGRKLGERLKAKGDLSGGFENKASTEAMKEARLQLADLEEERDVQQVMASLALRKYDYMGFDDGGQALSAILEYPDWQQRWDMESAADEDMKDILDFKEAWAKHRDARIKIHETKKVPNVPFQKNWPLVLFKAAVRWAANNGMDEIGWTGGTIQAERYGLIQRVEDLEYREIGGLVDIWGYVEGDFQQFEHSGYTDAQLRTEFGDDIADRIKNREGQVNQFPEHVLTQALKGGMTEARATADIKQLMKQATTFGSDDHLQNVTESERLALGRLPPTEENSENKRIEGAWRRLTQAIGDAEEHLMGHYEVQPDMRDIIGDDLASAVGGPDPSWLIYDTMREKVIEAGFNTEGTAAQRLRNMKPNLWIQQMGVFEGEFETGIAPGWYVMRDEERISGPFEAEANARFSLHGFAPTDLNEVFHDTEYNHYKLEGVNLESGGEGMKAFYDGMMPAMTGKWLKKFDAEPVDQMIQTEPHRRRHDPRFRITDVAEWEEVVDALFEYEIFDKAELEAMTPEEILAYTANMDFEENRTIDHDKPAWTVVITDKLREAALKGIPMWKKRAQATKPSTDKVKNWLKGPIKRLRADIGVEIVETVEELRRKTGLNDIPDNVDGMMHQDKVWIVASRIANKNDAHRVMAHEVIGHLGLMKWLGKARYNNLRAKVMKMKVEAMFDPNPDNEFSAIVRQLREDYTNEYGDYELNPEQEADEIIAKVAEKKPRLGKLREIWNSLVNFMRQWLTKKGLWGGYSSKDIAYIESLLHKTVINVTTKGDRRQNKRAADIQNEVVTDQLHSREGGVTPAARARAGLEAMLDAQPDMFSYLPSPAKSMEQVTETVSAGAIKVKRASKEFIEDWYRRENSGMAEEEKPERVWNATLDVYNADGSLADRRDFDILEAGDSVWVDVAKIHEGAGGSVIYAAVANYAFNNDKVFIGDPSGLSDHAFHRRLENMISTALKFGTTRHIFPHIKQTGREHWNYRAPQSMSDEKLDMVAPTTTGYLHDWQVGNHEHNIEQMLTLSYNNAHAFITGKSAPGFDPIPGLELETATKDMPPLAAYRFDRETNQFRSRTTDEILTDDDIQRLASSPGSRQINAGRNTIKRALLVGSFIEQQGVGSQKISEWVAQYANESLPEQLAGTFYSRKGKPLGANQRKGNLTILKKEWPAVHKAVLSAMKRMDPAPQALLKGNLKKHSGTGWAASAVKSLAIRDIFHGLMNGRDVSTLMADSFWGKDSPGRYEMVKWLKKGPAGLERFAQTYNFIGTNRKAENDVPGSFLNCDPSVACATFCYAVKANGRHVELMKAEFTELANTMFPDVVAKNIVAHYKHSAAGLDHLALRINDKGDLSEVQLGMVRRLNQEGIALQIFSKRPELLRQLSDMNLKMLSIDETNFNLALENTDLSLAVTLTDGFTDEMVDTIKDRVAVYLPVNLRGKVWNTAVLKEKYPANFSDMRKAMCPVEAGKVTTRKGIQFVDVMAGLADGNWTCTACDKLGAHGCFNGARQTKNRLSALGMYELEVNGIKGQADDAMRGVEQHIRKLQAMGAIDEDSATRALSELRTPSGTTFSESFPDPEATGDQGSGRTRARNRSDRKGARGDAGRADEEVGFDEIWPPDDKPTYSRKNLGHKEATKRLPALQEVMAGIMDGTTDRAAYDHAVEQHKPVEAYTYVPHPAERPQMESALASNKVDKIGIPYRDLATGAPVGLRLDIPAYTNHGVWVVSVHGQKGTFDAGKVIGYDNVARVKNATFGSNEKVSQKIAAGGPKSTIAVIKGEWEPTTAEDAVALANRVLIHGDWTQVGFDPERHSYFFDRHSMKPVVAADEVVQIGPLVLARNPQYASNEGFLYSRRRQTEPELAAHTRIGAAMRDITQNGTIIAKEQGWGLLTVRQIAEQVYHILPSIHDEYVTYLNRMETVKNRFKDRAGIIASGRRKKLNDKQNDQLSRMQHEATIDGVDPDVPYEPIIEPEHAAARIKVLKQQIYGRAGDDKSKMIEEMKHIKMLLGQEANRKKMRSKVEAMWADLNWEQQGIYRAERDFHTDLREAQQNALLERIMDAQVDEAVKSGIMDKLRAQFEADSVHAPYFPLARFGKYFVLSMQDGEAYYDMFENQGEWNRHKRDVEETGGKVTGAGKIMEQDYKKLDVDPEFVGQVDKLVSSLGTHEKVTEIRDEIYQLYLQALPELSARKHAIHRSKIRGFYMDHLRAFANTAQHGANMLGRLKFGHKMQATLDEARKAALMAQYPSNYDAVTDELEILREYLEDDLGEMTDREIRQEIKDAREAEDDELLHKWQQVRDIKRSTEQIRAEPGQASPYLPDVIQKRIDRRVKLLDMADRIIKYDKSLTSVGGSMTEHVLDELGRSQDAMMNPNVSAWASNLNAMGFVWYLGFSLGAGVVNMTQTYAIGLPVLGAKLGWKQSANHLASISAQVVAARKANPDAKGFIGVEKLLKNADEKKAFQRWHDEGLLNDTLAHDLQGISDAGINTGQFKHKFMNTMAWVFHHAERLNREITALSAYRAAIEKGQSPLQAAITAELLTWKVHFDYGQNNRARFMRGNWMRVITQFKQYSQNITYLYGSELKKSNERLSPHLSKEERWEAKKTLFGMLGMQSLFGGSLSLPLVGAFIWLAEAFFDDDDDDPREFEAEYRQWLRDNTPDMPQVPGTEWPREKALSHFIAKGAIDAFTPFSMHGRLTLSDLWIRTSDRELEGDAGMLDLTKAMLGPQMSIAHGIYRGVGQMKRGKYWRGFETMAPKWVRDPMKATRYTYEDAKSFSGIDIKDMSPQEIASTLIGLSSSDLSEIYDQTNAVRNIETRRRQRRRLLMDKVVAEADSGKLSKELIGELQEWSKKNPLNAINSDSIEAALRSRQTVENQMVYGVRRTKSNTDLLDRFNYAE